MGAEASSAAHQVWTNIGGMQLVGVQPLASVPEVVEQDARAPLQTESCGSHGSRLATQSELGSQ